MASFRNPFAVRAPDLRSNPARDSRPSRSSRNPRFAPEFLEGRLSPSTFALAAVPAQISTYTSTTATFAVARGEEPLPTDPNGDPIPKPIGDKPGHDVPI
ncbi:hypothetical protein [Tautonia plasticadhaerens]|uniref:Uncharacterized protein n=1 Tax=Tautonia plasticadhaerens TaxID=2527974 RepID=A0A518H5E1_9BACT|nr:hypothetical protein [Tautonia plasticadhaerens]QDV36028.1 hypothetical protein ElP_39380 [Tautonia plasticadhaerens]